MTAVPPKASRPPLLLIEDTQSLQMLYRAVLTGAGHTVVAASTAAEGLRLFAETGATTVLLDLVLPDRDGLSLMQDMLQVRPETTVIVMTAHGSVMKAVAAMRNDSSVWRRSEMSVCVMTAPPAPPKPRGMMVMANQRTCVGESHG